MSVEQNVAIVQRLCEAFNRGDLDAAIGPLREDAVVEDVALGLTLRGPEGFRQWLHTWRTAVPDATTEVANVVAAGEWVATEHTGRGTHRGPLTTPAGEVPATGRPLELRVAELFQLKDGKIVAIRAYWDSASLLRQIGMIA